MAPTNNAAISLEERTEIFHEQYDYDIDAGDTLADLVLATGDYLSRIVGPAVADRAMAVIAETVSHGPLADVGSWREVLDQERSNCFSDWPLGARLHNLAAYAIYGIALEEGEVAGTPEERIRKLMEDAEAFLAASPMAQWGIDSKGGSQFTRLVLLARNRWALDNGQPVDPVALAIFGGVTEGRVRNMMSDRKFIAEDGRIPAQQALAWLKDRREFWNSIWREQRLPTYGAKPTAPLHEAVFVPVGRDGSAFHPGLRRKSGFTIGEKGSEKQVAEFDKALAELQLMRVPYWRRPNDRGNWGIVAGVRWERVEASDLEILAENPDHRLPDTNRP